MAKRKWKGELTQDLRSVSGTTLKKGTEVICWKKRMYERSNIDDSLIWKGKYEYHYTRKSDNKGLIRTTKFLIKDQIGDPNITF